MFSELMVATSVLTSSAEPTDTLVLGDGTRLALRPLGSEDRDGVAALFARLSPESRYRRFLSPKRELTPRELAFLTDIDHIHHEAIAAVDQRDGSIVGGNCSGNEMRQRHRVLDRRTAAKPALWRDRWRLPRTHVRPVRAQHRDSRTVEFRNTSQRKLGRGT